MKWEQQASYHFFRSSSSKLMAIANSTGLQKKSICLLLVPDSSWSMTDDKGQETGFRWRKTNGKKASSNVAVAVVDAG